jgi:hypothetical protein
MSCGRFQIPYVFAPYTYRVLYNGSLTMVSIVLFSFFFFSFRNLTPHKSSKISRIYTLKINKNLQCWLVMRKITITSQ